MQRSLTTETQKNNQGKTKGHNRTPNTRQGMLSCLFKSVVRRLEGSVPNKSDCSVSMLDRSNQVSPSEVLPAKRETLHESPRSAWAPSRFHIQPEFLCERDRRRTSKVCRPAGIAGRFGNGPSSIRFRAKEPWLKEFFFKFNENLG